MKRILVLTLALIFALSFTACGTAEKVVSDAESMGEDAASNVQSATDEVASDLMGEDKKNEDKSSVDLMAKITPEQAQSKAFEHAKLEKEQIRDVEIDLDRDNGKLVYEVNFNSGNVEYDYEIDAETGEIISFGKD